MAPATEWLREHLARRIWRVGETPAHVAEVHVWQRRQSWGGTTALYTVAFTGCDDTSVEQLYIGYEFPPAVLDAEYRSAVSNATIAPALGRAVTLIPEAHLLLVAFPNDRRMRALDEESLRAAVDRLATVLANNRGHRGPAWRVKEANVDILRYVPGQRLTLRCRGGFVADSGMEQPFTFIAKQYRERKVAQRLHRDISALYKYVSRSHGAWLPRPMAFDAETGLVVMEDLPGKDLMAALGEVDLSKTMWAVGQMLVALHQAPHVVRRSLSVPETLEEVRHAVEKIESLLPIGLARRAMSLIWRLAARRRDVDADDAPKVLLHGAFRPKHVFVHDGRLAMIDMDGMGVGHPAHDLGHFLSALYYLEAQEMLNAADRSVAVGHFLQGYAAAAPWRLQPAAVLWCTAASLVHKQVRKYVVHLHEDRADKVERVLALAEKALAACDGLRSGAPLDLVRSVLC